MCSSTAGRRFLSTPSARRATCPPYLWQTGRSYFYPRPPRGGRRLQGKSCWTPQIFLSTPSARRATSLTGNGHEPEYISIHALCEEGDLVIQPFGQTLEDFYPRPLRGGRHLFDMLVPFAALISIHALCEEGDFWRYISVTSLSLFLSTPSARRATSTLPTPNLMQ